MNGPAIRAVMDRRLLVNYRVDPDLLASFLPAPFRPALVGGYGIAGICLIRLSRVRPAGVPAKLGLTSENAAHRVAVCWDDAAGPVSGDEACEAESLASLEAFRIELYRRDSPAAEQEPGAVVKPVRSGRPGARVIRPGGAR